MNSLRLAAICLSLSVTACTSTYNGRVVARDGSPIGGARIQAFGGRSIFSATPWDWSPGTRQRGNASSAADGSFILHASALHIEKIAAESDAGAGAEYEPSSGRPLTVMVGPK